MKISQVSGKRWLVAGIFVLAMFIFTQLAFAEGEEETVNYGFLTLVTPIIAIVLSFITKQVIVSLAIAVTSFRAS